MKKIFKITALIFIITHSLVHGQTKTNSATPPVVTQKNNNAVFRLYQTVNIFTFIKLNTRTGQMWQIQHHTDEEKRFETYLNPKSLISTEKEENGRFTLYPTQNNYTFLLLDQIDGKTWQVQWSTKGEERFVYPIE
jgi:hypothetical protein